MRLKINLLLFLLLMVAGCTHNNGDIGPWFGNWQLTTVEPCNGAEAIPLEKWELVTFSFQASVVKVSQYLPHHESNSHYGTFVISDDNKQLILYFNHSDDESTAGKGVYSPPAFIGIDNPINVLEILKLSHKEIILKTQAYTYTLIKI